MSHLAPPTSTSRPADPAPDVEASRSRAASTGEGLRLDALTVTLGGRLIVDGLDLTIDAGELVSLLGPSGCGKTTTLRMIGGFLAPDAGRVLIGGQDVTALGAQHRPTAMVFQNYALWPHMSVLKNVMFPLTVRGASRAQAHQTAMAALETVDLAHHAGSRPARISGGEQQRAALARAIVAEPQLLLLDEPLSNLDARLRVRVREDIRALQQRLGITTVLVTHDQEEALAISDRIAVMSAGRLEQVAAPAELYARPATLGVASFIGSMTFLDGADLTSATTASREAPAAGGADVWAVRPEDVHFDAGADVPASGASWSGSAGSAGEAEVVQVRPQGPFSELGLLAGPRRLPLRCLVAGAGPRLGQRGGVRLGRRLHYVAGVLVDVLDDVPADTARRAAPIATASSAPVAAGS